jgi:hypothetical protein
MKCNYLNDGQIYCIYFIQSIIMKKLAFFVALFIGLNASPVVRRPEEEEGQAIVQHDTHQRKATGYVSVIQLLTQRISVYFYAITREGIFHKISWERIAEIIQKQEIQSRVTRVFYQNESMGNHEKSELRIF